jgi:hypothetical protein
MRETELIAFLVARGVDFEYTAGNASNLEGDASRRRMTRSERKAAVDQGSTTQVTDTVTGTQTRVYRKPVWSHQELALAAKGMALTPWLAVCFTHGRDISAREHLFHELHVESAIFARKEHWPTSVHDAAGKVLFYHAPLIDLLLTQQLHGGRFTHAQAQLLLPVEALLLNVTETIWERYLSDKYLRLQQKYEAWLAEGRSLVRQRIMGAPI